jgi:mono/diheme cytochrome c family protein
LIDFIYDLLKGIGFTEPIHPPITHMPIGLAVGALLFLAMALILKKTKLVLTARHVSIMAFVFAFPTILLGAFDWIHFYHAAFITPIVIKMILAGILLIVLGTGIIIGSELKPNSAAMMVLYSAAFVCVLGLGFFGSGLIYGRGVNDSSAASTSSTPSTEQVAAGAQVYTANCQSCHPNGGNSLLANYPVKTSTKLESRDSFIQFIRNPVMKDGAQGDMPAFSEQDIGVKDAEALYGYIKAMVAEKWK